MNSRHVQRNGVICSLQLTEFRGGDQPTPYRNKPDLAANYLKYTHGCIRYLLGGINRGLTVPVKATPSSFPDALSLCAAIVSGPVIILGFNFYVKKNDK